MTLDRGDRGDVQSSIGALPDQAAHVLRIDSDGADERKGIKEAYPFASAPTRLQRPVASDSRRRGVSWRRDRTCDGEIWTGAAGPIPDECTVVDRGLISSSAIAG
jgi:hypothetical protein